MQPLVVGEKFRGFGGFAVRGLIELELRCRFRVRILMQQE